ncbi:MAG: lipoyl synthase [Candidatus Omnitrophota bacterium]|nr:lipoyl synthase [Candidatus Omnitrophota bacterium]
MTLSTLLEGEIKAPRRLPPWLRRSLPAESSEKTHGILARYGLNTVCESAMCPNRNECYSGGTATFMILGNVCTRRCGFCAVETGRGEELSADEPARVADAASAMGLSYVVVTSVARDDLADEGAVHFAETVKSIKRRIDGVRVEVLTPDFHARRELIKTVVDAAPDVYNHNVETVRRLQREVRVQASYERSLEVLLTAKEINSEIYTKSGLMLGLGETDAECLETGRDLRRVGCDIVTIGQYLQPTQGHVDVVDYVRPERFSYLAEEMKKLGFHDVFSGPYVRSSYHAGESYEAING